MTKKGLPTGGGETGFKYAIHNLDLSKVKLSESPLDDYQRLFFATLLSRPNVDQRRNVDVRRVTYKSNIAESFACPSSLGIAQDAAVPRLGEATSPRSPATERRGSGGQARKVLDCFEYQLPDVDTADALGNSELSLLPEDFRENLGLKDRPKQLLRGSISTSGEEKHTSAVPVLAASYAAAGTEDRNAAASVNSLTKNQQFKLRKLDHTLQQNSKLINPNNCVLWTHGSGYVFLTGIWRLCQDVMRGLISVPRLDEANTEELQNMCRRELSYIITTAFYEASSSCVAVNSTDRRKRRHSSGSDIGATLNVSGFQGSSLGTSETSNTGASSSNPHYTDLHWNSLSGELKQMMCDTYKNHLIKETGFLPQEAANCDYTEVIKRIRGGYIKIQGTWLPFETARLLCVRFCYPIRYLLVPIFGPLFPRECEDWYVAIQHRLLTSERERQLDTSEEVQSQQRRRKRRDSSKAKVSKPVGNELSNAFRNLLDISKNPPLSPPQVRRRSTSCAPECTAFMPRRSSSEKLPPISTIMQLVVPSSAAGDRSGQITRRNDIEKTSVVSSENVHLADGDACLRKSRQLQIYPNPTVQTLSHLASFYNTRGHRYSYPGNVYMSHQKPVINRPQVGNQPNCEPPEYHAKPDIGSPQVATMQLAIPNYRHYKKESDERSDRCFPGSAMAGPTADDLVSPRTVGPGQSTRQESLVTVYPETTSPYWFNPTR